MKKLIIALLVAVALMLSGCGMSFEGGIDIHFERDTETGVYYVVSSDGGVCPRYNAYGTLYTGGTE